jgi:hypothetical protein
MSVETTEEMINAPVIKKRGRKPKGGKIIQPTVPDMVDKLHNQNIILHLNCSLKDLEMNNSNLEYCNLENIKYIQYENITNMNDTPSTFHENITIREPNLTDIWAKLKKLQHNLHTNNLNNKKSGCFWCTYDFDSPTIHIPKYYLNGIYNVYGCFCSPECATAFLMKENVDSSVRFERYHLLNYIYGKIYNYSKNIQPAPDPFYTLEKYYGNLTIQDYRKLLTTDCLYLVLNKPLTRNFPELHDNMDIMVDNKIITSSTYKIKKNKKDTN